MAKASDYITEYEAALQEYNRLVENFNARVDAYTSGGYQNYMGATADTAPMLAFYIPEYNAYQLYRGDPMNVPGEWSGAPERYYRDNSPEWGDFEFVKTGSGRNTNTGRRYDAGYLRKKGVTENPFEEFTATAPAFDVEKYQTLLSEDMALERQAVQEAFEKSQAEEKAKFEEQRAEMERQQAILAAESAAAEKQAQENLAQAQADAAAAQEERVKKEAQFKDETETMQRNVGARRAGFIRARRMRSRSLLSGA